MCVQHYAGSSRLQAGRAAMFGTLVRDIFLGAKLTFFFAYIVGRALLNVDLFVSFVALLWTKFKLTFF